MASTSSLFPAACSSGSSLAWCEPVEIACILLSRLSPPCDKHSSGQRGVDWFLCHRKTEAVSSRSKMTAWNCGTCRATSWAAFFLGSPLEKSLFGMRTFGFESNKSRLGSRHILCPRAPMALGLGYHPPFVAVLLCHNRT